jgi:hypothetical protein
VAVTASDITGADRILTTCLAGFDRVVRDRGVAGAARAVTPEGFFCILLAF